MKSILRKYVRYGNMHTILWTKITVLIVMQPHYYLFTHLNDYIENLKKSSLN